MNAPVRIVGSYLSPFVRKVLACLDIKGLPYEIDPIPPFFGDDRFTQLSPLRRVPVLIDDRVTLADSTVIVQYLEDRYPRPTLFPVDVADRARARWFEEYADTRLADLLVWGVFRKAVLEPGIFGIPRDVAAIERIVREDLPVAFDYLETSVPGDGFLFGEPGIADIALAVPFRNLGYARQRIDAERWPVTASYVNRVLALPCLTKLQVFEELSMRTAVAQQRKALAAAGAPLTADTIGGASPRPGQMRS
ncbi:MAG TPA: glutathione S-transferase family protein [Steroidobacteraceae bacterium]